APRSTAARSARLTPRFRGGEDGGVERLALALLVAAGGCGGSDSPGDRAAGGGLSSVGGGKDLGGDLAVSLVNPHPTISSWVGTNVSSDLARVDITYQLSPFDTPSAMQDANGYPAMGASGKSSTDLGFILTTGSYNISFKGNGTLAV